jgi:uncharacterized protein involved in outer membrane biogenesis
VIVLEGISMMRKLLWTLLSVLILFVLVLVIVPPLINWNNYKSEIIQLVKERTGVDMDIKGAIRLRAFPTPAISIKNIEIKETPTLPVNARFTLKSAELNIALLPLLGLNVEITSLNFNQPRIKIFGINKSSTALQSIENEIQAELVDTPLPPASVPVSAHKMPGFLKKIKINKLKIEKGDFIYENQQMKTHHEAKNVDISITMDSLLGPYKAQGSATINGVAGEVETSISELDFNKPLQISNKFSVSGITAKLNGAVNFTRDSVDFKGNIDCSSDNLGDSLKLFMTDIPNALNQKFAIRSTVIANVNEAKLTDITFNAAGIIGDGSIAVSFDQKLQMDAKLHVNPVNITQLVYAKSFKQFDYKFDPFSSAFAVSQKIPQKIAFHIPKFINANIDVSLDGFTYNKAAFRNGHALISVANGILDLKNTSIEFPGGGKANLSGQLKNNQSHIPEFNGQFSTTINNLKSLLEIFNVPALPPGLPRNFKLDTRLQANMDKVQCTNLVGYFGKSKITGTIGAALAQKFKLNGDFVIDQFDFNSLTAMKTVQNNHGPIVLVADKIEPRSTVWDILKIFDADVRVKLIKGVYKEHILKNIDLHTLLQNGAIHLQQATFGDVAGFSGKLSGVVQEDQDLFKFAYQTNLTTALKDIGPVTITNKASGTYTSTSIDILVNALNANVSANATLSLQNPFTTLKGAFKITHPESADFIASLMGKRATQKIGSLSIESPFHVKELGFELPNIKGNIGETMLYGNVKSEMKNFRPYVFASLGLGKVDLNKLLSLEDKVQLSQYIAIEPKIQLAAYRPQNPNAWSRAALDLSGLKALDATIHLTASDVIYKDYVLNNAKTKITLKDGVLSLDEGNGALFGGTLSASGSLNTKQNNNANFNFTIANANLKQAAQQSINKDVVLGMLNGNLSVTTNGRSVHELMHRLNGKAQFNIKDGVINGIDLVSLNESIKDLKSLDSFIKLLGAVSNGGQTPIRAASGNFTIQNGVMRSTDTHVEFPVGRGTATGYIDIGEKALDMFVNVQLSSREDAPPLGLHLYGNWDRIHKRLKTKKLQQHLMKKGAFNIITNNFKITNGEDGESNNMVGSILSQVLGGGDSQQEETEQHTTEHQKEKPRKKKRFKNLFNDLLKEIH